NSGGASSNYGVYGKTTTSGSASNYAIYGTASGASINNWAGYFDQGNIFVQNRMRVGGSSSTTPSFPIEVVTSGSAYGLQQTDGTVQMATYVGTGGAYGGSIGTITAHPFFIFTSAGGARLT